MTSHGMFGAALCQQEKIPGKSKQKRSNRNMTRSTASTWDAPFSLFRAKCRDASGGLMMVIPMNEMARRECGFVIHVAIPVLRRPDPCLLSQQLNLSSAPSCSRAPRPFCPMGSGELSDGVWRWLYGEYQSLKVLMGRCCCTKGRDECTFHLCLE